MKEVHHADVENVLPQTSSSYGSLDCPISSDSQLQSPLAGDSSSSNRTGGLSMHVQESFKQTNGNPPSSTSSILATSAADCISVDSNNAFGSDGFKKKDDAARGHHDSNQRQKPNHPAHEEHLVKSRQYYRDMVLGVNDGLVSTFLLVAGVVGGGMDVEGVLLTAISGAIAGAISMFAGEYVATKSQNEVMEGEIKLEHDHIKKYHEEEMQELTSLFTLIGIPGSQSNLCFDQNERPVLSANAVNVSSAVEAQKLRRRMTRYYASNPDALLKIMIALEFGVIVRDPCPELPINARVAHSHLLVNKLQDDEVRSPLVAGGTSLALFFMGALPSIIPFACIEDPVTGLIVAGLACAVGLLFVGAVKTWATRGSMWFASLENLMITAVGGAIAYGIGVGFQSLVRNDE
ncbi:hypothetical protein ACHAWF_011390 [Thalassiosira exigua]